MAFSAGESWMKKTLMIVVPALKPGEELFVMNLKDFDECTKITDKKPDKTSIDWTADEYEAGDDQKKLQIMLHFAMKWPRKWRHVRVELRRRQTRKKQQAARNANKAAKATRAKQLLTAHYAAGAKKVSMKQEPRENE